jgi:hypothetical protein
LRDLDFRLNQHPVHPADRIANGQIQGDAFGQRHQRGDGSFCWAAVHLHLDIPAQIYNVYVTPEGGSQVQIGANYAFRLSAPTLSNVTYHAEVGSNNVCSFNLPLGGNQP